MYDIEAKQQSDAIFINAIVKISTKLNNMKIKILNYDHVCLTKTLKQTDTLSYIKVGKQCK